MVCSITEKICWGSYLYLVDGENWLNVWLHRMNDDRVHGGNTNRWDVLRDTISLRETCGHLVEPETTGDKDEDAPALMVVGAGDNMEFVFL